jgi:hypothetical protein
LLFALLRTGELKAPTVAYAKLQICAMINACFLPFTEGLAPFREAIRVGPLIMLSNASVAFGLNVAAVFLIGAAGGLVLTLAGVFKDILLITSSCLFFGSTITPIQIFGQTSLLLALRMIDAYDQDIH